MDAISQIEKMLGTSYGTPPTAVPMTFSNKAMAVINKQGMTPKSILSAVAFGLHGTADAFYASRLHRIFLKPNSVPEFEAYTLTHEYMHGYIHPRNPEFSDSKTGYEEWKINFAWATLQQALGLPERAVDNRKLEEYLILQSVDEGLSDYVAVQTAVAQNNSLGIKVDRKYIDWIKPGCEIRLDGKLIEIPRNALEICRKRWEYLHRRVESGKDKATSFDAMTDLIEQQKYKIGYIAMRLALGDRTKNIGKRVDQIIKNPPRSFAQLDELVLRRRNH